jgi:Ca2+-binding EF-hand superfamily protein
LDRGRSLFDRLDTNKNGRLDFDELRRAADLLAEGESWSREDIPCCVVVTLGPPTSRGSFGPIKLNSRSQRTSTVQNSAAPRGPRWFRAMDRNGDGYLSPAEFLGPPELFRQIDTDGDGRISPEEAEKAAGETRPKR